MFLVRGIYAAVHKQLWSISYVSGTTLSIDVLSFLL